MSLTLSPLHKEIFSVIDADGSSLNTFHHTCSTPTFCAQFDTLSVLINLIMFGKKELGEEGEGYEMMMYFLSPKVYYLIILSHET